MRFSNSDMHRVHKDLIVWDEDTIHINCYTDKNILWLNKTVFSGRKTREVGMHLKVAYWEFI